MLIFTDLGYTKSEKNSSNPRTNFVLHGVMNSKATLVNFGVTMTITKQKKRMYLTVSPILRCEATANFISRNGQYRGTIVLRYFFVSVPTVLFLNFQ